MTEDELGRLPWTFSLKGAFSDVGRPRRSNMVPAKYGKIISLSSVAAGVKPWTVQLLRGQSGALQGLTANPWRSSWARTTSNVKRGGARLSCRPR